MTTCPIPVDWLDLLDGRPSTADRGHLAECPSCAAIVAALSAESSMTTESLAAKALTLGLEASPVALPPPPSLGRPAVGQLWWTVEAPDVGGRLAVLIMGIEEADVAWLDAVPLLADDGLGTSGDVLLLPEDTSTNLAWRALFRHQLVLSPAQLESGIGELTKLGARLLEDVLAGHPPIGRAGSLLESENDPRLAADEWVGVASRILAAEYAAAIERQEESWEAEPARVILLVLKVSNQPAPKQGAPYQLAAATSSSALQWVRATGEDARIGAHVDGWLRLSERDEHEELIFEVKEARGIPERVRIALYTRVKTDAIVTEAALEAGREVVLGADLGLSEFDIERLEIGAG
jgi:hypothetical protein